MTTKEIKERVKELSDMGDYFPKEEMEYLIRRIEFLEASLENCGEVVVSALKEES